MSNNSLFFYAGVFLITASTLMFQLAETRILSVILWYHLAFFAISMAMFGLTLGAVWVYYHQERYAASLSYYLAYFSTAFGVSMVFSLVGQLLLPVTISLSLTALLAWLLLAVFLALPYVFSGITVSLALTQSPFPVSRVYGVDMVGAAVDNCHSFIAGERPFARSASLPGSNPGIRCPSDIIPGDRLEFLSPEVIPVREIPDHPVAPGTKIPAQTDSDLPSGAHLLVGATAGTGGGNGRRALK